MFHAGELFQSLLWVLLFLGPVLSAQAPLSLGDLNKDVSARLSSSPSAFTYDPAAPHLANRFPAIGNICFFRADDGIHGKELWGSAGSPGTTAMIKDIVPGKEGSAPWDFRVFRGKVYFSAWTPRTGREIWVSDGTAGGTRLLADLHPGPKDGGFIDPVVMGKSLYFFASCDFVRGPFALFRYDGGPNPPVLVKGGFSLPWKEPVPAGGFLVFRGVTAGSGAEAWVSDGTAKGTFQLRDFNKFQDGDCAHPVGAGGKAWFCAMDSGGWAVWETDGRKAVRVAALPFNGRPWTTPLLLGSRVVFGAPSRADLGENPYAFDTVTGKVILLRRITSDFRHGFLRPLVWKGKVWFSARQGSDPSHRPSLWSTDGTPAGTLKAVPEGVYPAYDWFDPVGGMNFIFFRAFVMGPYGSGFALWRTDGTGKGTLCLDAAPGGPGPTEPWFMTPLGGRVLYSGVHPNLGRELFWSDGTPRGTGLLKEINRQVVTACSYPEGFTGFLGKTWFQAGSKGDGRKSRELWVTDGTRRGTRRVSPLEFSGMSELLPGPFGIFFSGISGKVKGLWRSDGTAAGTRCFFPFGGGFLRPVPFRNKVLFAAWTDKNGWEPWVTDGTARGTHLLADTLPGVASGWFMECVPLGGAAVFTAAAKAGKSTLWVTDGSSAGTKPLAPALVHATNLVRLGDKILFEGEDGKSFLGKEPWVTDGTKAGTARLVDLFPGAKSGGFQCPFRVEDRVFFLGRDKSLPPGKFGLFWTDGTARGVRRVGSYAFQGMAPISRPFKRHVWGLPLGGGRAVFWPFQGGACKGPWVTDGTAAGTGPLKSFKWPWKPGDAVSAWGGTGGRVVFRPKGCAWTQVKGSFWITDGTPGGTKPLDAFWKAGFKRVWPEAGLSGGLLYAAADDGATGFEPWVLPVGAAVEEAGWSGGPTELAAGVARLGGTVSFRILGFPSNSTGLFFVGFPGFLPVDLGAGQFLYLDPGRFLFRVGSSTAGKGSLKVPADPSLRGGRVLLQGAVFPVSSPPFGMDFTNGILWTLGK